MNPFDYVNDINYGKKNLISRITSESAVSLHLHNKLGFETIGVMKQCGIKFEKVLDVNLLQYLYY